MIHQESNALFSMRSLSTSCAVRKAAGHVTRNPPGRPTPMESLKPQRPIALQATQRSDRIQHSARDGFGSLAVLIDIIY